MVAILSSLKFSGKHRDLEKKSFLFNDNFLYKWCICDTLLINGEIFEGLNTFRINIIIQVSFGILKYLKVLWKTYVIGTKTTWIVMYLLSNSSNLNFTQHLIEYVYGYCGIRIQYYVFTKLFKIFTSFYHVYIIIIKAIKRTKNKITFKEGNIWNYVVVLTLYPMQFYGNQHAACNYIPLKSSITRNNCHTRSFLIMKKVERKITYYFWSL